MPSSSPIRDIMIELLADDSGGLPVCQAAGEVIAADAAANIRAADAEGHTTPQKLVDTIHAYGAALEAAQEARDAFKAGIAARGPYDQEASETLLEALHRLRAQLDRVA